MQPSALQSYAVPGKGRNPCPFLNRQQPTVKLPHNPFSTLNNPVQPKTIPSQNPARERD